MTVAVKLYITPKRPGKIIMKRVEWDILETFRCHFPLINDPGLIVDKSMEVTLNKLSAAVNMFKYKVVQESAHITTAFMLSRNSDISTHRKDKINTVLFTETDKGDFSIKNYSKSLSIGNMHLFCSHPIVVGFVAIPIKNGDRLMASEN